MRDDADDPGTRTCRKQEFRGMRREAHDPLGRPRQCHDIAGVVRRRHGCNDAACAD
jgi:hypothetical protein